MIKFKQYLRELSNDDLVHRVDTEPTKNFSKNLRTYHHSPDWSVSGSSRVSGFSRTRGLFAGGETVNTIQYVTIASTGNTTDFGDLQYPSYLITAASNAHGGL